MDAELLTAFIKTDAHSWIKCLHITQEGMVSKLLVPSLAPVQGEGCVHLTLSRPTCSRASSTEIRSGFYSSHAIHLTLSRPFVVEHLLARSTVVSILPKPYASDSSGIVCVYTFPCYRVQLEIGTFFSHA